MLEYYIGSEIVIPGRETLPILGEIKKRKWGASGNPIEYKNSNTILYSRIYKFEFPDRRIEDFPVSFLAGNIFSQADSDGCNRVLINEFIYFQKDPSIAPAEEDGTFIAVSG